MQKKFLLLIFTMFFALGTLVPNALAAETSNRKTQAYRFGVITLSHPLIIYRQYLPFIDYINKQSPWEFELVLYKEYAEVVEAIKNGELDMALLGGSSFANTSKFTRLEPIASVLSRDHSAKTYSLIITKEDNNNINTVQDLRGKSMAFGPTQSTSSYIIPLNFLKVNDINLPDFKIYKNLNSHDAVVRAVLRGDYDAGAIGEAFAQKFLGHGLKIVGETSKFPSFIIVACPNVLPEVRQDVQNILLKIQANNQDFIKISNDWPEILRHGFAPVVKDDYKIFQSYHEAQ